MQRLPVFKGGIGGYLERRTMRDPAPDEDGLYTQFSASGMVVQGRVADPTLLSTSEYAELQRFEQQRRGLSPGLLIGLGFLAVTLFAGGISLALSLGFRETGAVLIACASWCVAGWVVHCFGTDRSGRPWEGQVFEGYQRERAQREEIAELKKEIEFLRR